MHHQPLVMQKDTFHNNKKLLRRFLNNLKMSEKILVPVLGESITEATVAKWLKNQGDAVDADEPIVELETDKVNLEVPSPVTGKLTEINSKNGATVKVGEILGFVTEIIGEIEKSNEIKKIQPSNLQKNEETKKKDNVIKLDPVKEQADALGRYFSVLLRGICKVVNLLAQEL